MSDPYLDALKMLARRELSEAQVRQRLARRGHQDDAIDGAITRLKEARAIDDARVAELIARTETSVKRRGRLRVTRQIESAGIARAIASRAVAQVFDQIDEAALMDSALAKRMRNRTSIEDEAELHRLYRYLVGQGFEPDRVLKTLKGLRGYGK